MRTPLCLSIAALALCLSGAACAKSANATKGAKPAAASSKHGATHFMDEAKAGKPLYATIVTSLGTITAELDSKAAPNAVTNFVGLASGEKAWTTPAGEKTQKPLYTGTLFHRVIPGFMIQGGDPEGTGAGGPGFSIPDDFPNQHGLHFTKGILGMARTGAPNSGGSQFFIMVAAYPSLDGKYTVFGHVLSGQDVADKISLVPRNGADRPNTPVVIKSVTISDKMPKK